MSFVMNMNNNNRSAHVLSKSIHVQSTRGRRGLKPTACGGKNEILILLIDETGKETLLSLLLVQVMDPKYIGISEN